jgi:putative aldouronate transport system permease protein
VAARQQDGAAGWDEADRRARKNEGEGRPENGRALAIMLRRSTGERIFAVFNGAFMVFLMAITLYPLWYVLIASFSNPLAVSRGVVTVLPYGLELASYQRVFETKNIWTSYANTVFYAVVGTAVSMALTVLGAYPLSKRRLAGRKLFMFAIMLTMWFGAGMMPTYLNFKELGLLDTRLGLILCFAVSTFNVILMRTFFENVPDSMEESAKMDGANDWHILFRIYLPLSVPAIAAITMYYFVGRWNSFFWAMMLLSDQTKVPLQVLLRRLIVDVSYSLNEYADVSANVMTEQTIVYATIVVAVIPMLILYPFIQKYFVKGVMVGAIKG